MYKSENFQIKHALELLKDTFDYEAVVVTFEIILSASNQQWHYDNSSLYSRTYSKSI